MNNQGEEHFEVEHKSEDTSEKQLADFKAEIRTLKSQEEQFQNLKNEAAARDAGGTWHFGKVNPDELTLEDREMWEVIKTYKTKAVPEHEELPLTLFKDYSVRAEASGNSSRSQFKNFIANKIFVILARAGMKKHNH